MSDLIELATGKLQDPILMDWAISRYQQMEKCQPQQREAMAQAWFDDLTLRCWLDSDNEEILNRLFVFLPAERFANLGQAISEHWGHWSGNLAYHAAPVLAQYQPDLALKCFAEPQGGRHQHVESLLGVIRSLPMLPPDDGLQLLQATSQQILNSSAGDHFTREMKLTELVSASLHLDRTLALEVITAYLQETSDKRRLNLLLDKVAQDLFGHSVYQQLASDIRSGQTQQSFRQLATFFREETPLAALDQLSAETARLDELSALIEQFLDDKDRTIVQRISATMQSNQFTKQQDRLADFLIGVVAAACERKTLDTANMSLQEAVQLLASDLSGPRFFEELFARLCVFEQEEVTPHLVETLDRERASYGSVWVAKAMGQLGWNAFIAPLTAAISEDCGDFLCEAAQEALVWIGPLARDHLIQHWDTLDPSQQIYGVSVIDIVGGKPAVAFAVDRYNELIQYDPEHWCRLALGAPDRTLLDLLQQQLPRQQRLFDKTFYQLARLLDVQHPELESIAARVQKVQAQQQTRQAALLRGDWSSNQSLMLELKCSVCGDSNEYQVQRIAVNPDSKDADLLLAEEIPCASCSRWVDFEFTSRAHIAITAELLKLAKNADKGSAGHSKVLVMMNAPYNGQQLPVSEVVSRCKLAVANSPERIVDWLRLGNCYHRILSRPRHGLGYAEQALALEPNAVEAILQKADAMTVQGDKEEAFQLLDQALESKQHWRFFLADVISPAQLTAQFARLYNELLGRLGRRDRARLHASFLGTSKKVGRNDPCPCGSGKKYKKCCIAKH